MRRMKKYLLIILLIIGITGCETRYITPNLPDFELIVPSRPTLTDDMESNVGELMIYSKKLEVVIQGWEDFYRGVRNDMGIR